MTPFFFASESRTGKNKLQRWKEIFLTRVNKKGKKRIKRSNKFSLDREPLLRPSDIRHIANHNAGPLSLFLGWKGAHTLEDASNGFSPIFSMKRRLLGPVNYHNRWSSVIPSLDIRVEILILCLLTFISLHGKMSPDGSHPWDVNETSSEDSSKSLWIKGSTNVKRIKASRKCVKTQLKKSPLNWFVCVCIEVAHSHDEECEDLK